MFLIAGFYLFCFIIIAVFLWSARVLARSQFRSEDEGCTVQIGYEEDPQGKVIPTELGSSGSDEEHVGGEATMHTPEH